MAKVNVEIGATIKLGDPMASYGNYFKCTMGVSDIDTERDLKEQLQASSVAIKSAFQYLLDKLNKEIDEQLDAKL